MKTLKDNLETLATDIDSLTNEFQMEIYAIR